MLVFFFELCHALQSTHAHQHKWRTPLLTITLLTDNVRDKLMVIMAPTTPLTIVRSLGSDGERCLLVLGFVFVHNFSKIDVAQWNQQGESSKHRQGQLARTKGYKRSSRRYSRFSSQRGWRGRMPLSELCYFLLEYLWKLFRNDWTLRNKKSHLSDFLFLSSSL